MSHIVHRDYLYSWQGQGEMGGWGDRLAKRMLTKRGIELNFNIILYYIGVIMCRFILPRLE